MVREPVPESWSRVLTNGLQLPWLNVLRATQPVDHPILSTPLLPIGFIAFVALLIFLVWRIEPPKRVSHQKLQPVTVES
jgi:hypothetical protein